MPGMKCSLRLQQQGAHIICRIASRGDRGLHGTRHNDTTQGWWNSASKMERSAVEVYLDRWQTPGVAADPGIEASVAQLAMLPAQDLFELGSEARMNTPAVGAATEAGARRREAGSRIGGASCRAGRRDGPRQRSAGKGEGASVDVTAWGIVSPSHIVSFFCYEVDVWKLMILNKLNWLR